MTTTTTEMSIQRLVDQLIRLSGSPRGRPVDRGVLATLRAWSRSASQYRAYGTLADLFNRAGIGADGLDDPIWTAIPTLYAWHQRHDLTIGGGFGKTLGLHAGAKRKSFDAHFRRLLACEKIEDLIGLLPRYVRRVGRPETKGTPIDFVLLYRDLRRWSQSPESARAVKVRWAGEYYAESLNDLEAKAKGDAA
ncbi:MAG: type I-E CRISPR-associated protein Cse2/CasB [Verrucomicrobiales bacterium]|nr:type I-E CRISPR-associated protein Cse2/CasB [Verrucomicrobiales bacterium]